jgi:transposase
MIVRAPRISKRKQNQLLHYFAQDKVASIAADDAKVSIECASRWYRHFREAIYRSLAKAPRFFGEVEMDTAFFGGRGRKRMHSLLARYKKIMPYSEYQAKAKIIRAEHKQEVFGILQRGGPVYVHLIKKADARTLTPIVRLIVERGSVVYTDKWRGFTELQLDGYEHRSVNHSEEYVTKEGVHINGIESFWSSASRRLAKFNGIPRHTLPLHLKECEWRYNNRDRDLEKVLKLLLTKN